MRTRLRNIALRIARRLPLGPLGPYVLDLALGTPFPHRRPRPLRWLWRALCLVLVAGVTLLALAVCGLSLGLVRLVRASERELLGLYPNRLLRAMQRLTEAGEKLEAAALILLQEGWRL